MAQNRHGLSRSIPKDKKYQIRKACGFGCVICGVTIYEYEHFNPEFKDAIEHEVEGIALLCPTHHAEVTKGVIPKSIVKNARKNPAALKSGFSKKDLPYFNGDIGFLIAGAVTKNTPIPLRVKGEPLFYVKRGQSRDEPALISGIVRDCSGMTILEICENEWKVSIDNADFEFVGSRYIFRDKNKDECLVLNFSIENFIYLEFLKTHVDGVFVGINAEYIQVGQQKIIQQGAYISNCMIGLDI